jgi:hypothetical protein
MTRFIVSLQCGSFQVFDGLMTCDVLDLYRSRKPLEIIQVTMGNIASRNGTQAERRSRILQHLPETLIHLTSDSM